MKKSILSNLVVCEYAYICPLRHKCEHVEPHEHTEQCDATCYINGSNKAAVCIAVDTDPIEPFELDESQSILDSNQKAVVPFGYTTIVADSTKDATKALMELQSKHNSVTIIAIRQTITIICNVK